MIDLKVMKSALEQLEEERKIPKEKILEAIEQALAAAYKKDYGKKGQIVRAKFDIDTGKTDFYQVKIAVDDSLVRMPEEGEEISEEEDDYGRIAAQTAKQVIIQKIREAERTSVMDEYGAKEGEITNGVVQKIERGNIYVDFSRATGILPVEEQIPGEFFRRGERIRAYLYSVEDSPRGINLRLSRTHPKFLEKLFALE